MYGIALRVDLSRTIIVAPEQIADWEETGKSRTVVTFRNGDKLDICESADDVGFLIHRYYRQPDKLPITSI